MDFDCDSNYIQQDKNFESKRSLFLRFIQRVKAQPYLCQDKNLASIELKNEDILELKKTKTNVAIMQKMLSEISATGSLNIETFTSIKNEFEKISEQLKLVSCIYERNEPQDILTHFIVDKENISRAQEIEEDSSKHIITTTVSLPPANPAELPPEENIKTESDEPFKVLTEEEETELWIEGLRKRKLLKKNNSSAIKNSEDSDEEAELLRQQHLQDELAGSLVSMAGVLKSNTMAFGDALHRDEQVLDEAQAALNSNLDKLTSEGRRLALLNASASKSTLLYYFSVVFVILVFLMTAIFIRTTAKRI